jgi:hypothetical protein
MAYGGIMLTRNVTELHFFQKILRDGDRQEDTLM